MVPHSNGTHRGPDYMTTMTTPDTYDTYSNPDRDTEVACRMAEIRLLEQMVSLMDDRNQLLEQQAEHLREINNHLRDTAYHTSGGADY